uniref:Putative translation initiation factor if-2 n=1 Tax=Amblyomma sculptum TaxID=1581419 RepID=A0A1E1XRU8_AMBSC
MAPAADEQKVSLDARGVLIMLVALGGIIGLWVNEFMVSEDNYPPGFVYVPPKRGGAKAPEPEVRQPPRPVLLTVEDCGKLALEAVREYVERHPIERDDSAEELPASRDDEDKAATSEEEPAVLDEFRRRAKAPDEEVGAAVSSEEEHEEEPPKKPAVESEEVKVKPKKPKAKKTAKKTKKTTT